MALQTPTIGLFIKLSNYAATGSLCAARLRST